MFLYYTEQNCFICSICVVLNLAPCVNKGEMMCPSSCLPLIMSSWQIASIMSRYWTSILVIWTIILKLVILQHRMSHCLFPQSIAPLVESLKLLSGPETCIICCYEKRTEGVNPEVERKFFEVQTNPQRFFFFFFQIFMCNLSLETCHHPRVSFGICLKSFFFVSLFQLLQQTFTCEKIPSDKQDPEFSSPDIHILHIRKKV